MAGYVGYSESCNAAEAREKNRHPATHAAKVARSLGLAGCTAGDIRAVLVPAEWHHVSKKYNPVDFFDCNEIDKSSDDFCEEVREELAERITLRKKLQKLCKKLADKDGTIQMMVPERPAERWYPTSYKKIMFGMVGECDANAHNIAHSIKRMEEQLEICNISRQGERQMKNHANEKSC